MGARGTRGSAAPVVFDSDVLIWYLRGAGAARRLIESVAYADRLMPAIVLMELTRGCRDRAELRRLGRFVEGSFARVIHGSEEISRRALTLVERHALSHRPTPGDALVAATALTLRARLATANAKDYRFVSGLTLVPFKP